MIGCLLARYLSSCTVAQSAQQDALPAQPALALATAHPLPLAHAPEEL